MSVSEPSSLSGVIAEMEKWTTSGMGGQTAMAIDRWVATLKRLQGEPSVPTAHGGRCTTHARQHHESRASHEAGPEHPLPLSEPRDL
jgi:hypothetical protein